MEYTPPKFRPPFRVLVLIAATDGWYEATSETRAQIAGELGTALREVEGSGVRLVSSFDDDLFLTGQPAPLSYSIFVVYDVDDLAVIVTLVHRFRTSALSGYLRVESRIGRKLFVLDR